MSQARSRQRVQKHFGLRSVDGHADVESVENRKAMARFGGLLTIGLAAIALVALLIVPAFGLHARGLDVRWSVTVDAFALVSGGLLLLAIRYAPSLPLVIYSSLALAVAVITLEAALAGELSPFTALGYVIVGTLAFVLMERWAASLYVALMAAGYGIVVALRPGNSSPVGRWLLVTGTIVLIGVTVAWLVDRIRTLAKTERLARADAETARQELAILNRTLEQKVEEQVAALERFGRLRRFLSRPVAEQVLSSDDLTPLAPHKREIAVLFCDLRGFTAFTASTEPEEVLGVLQEYFDLLGYLVDMHRATIGAFTGDGLMAFFNDPVPCEDPACEAIKLAVELRASMRPLLNRWTARGHALGIGVGIAFGDASIGVIGFEGRSDYTALGSVVNLAARLCGEARHDQILVDRSTRTSAGALAEVEEVGALSLKGFLHPIEVSAVTRLRATAF
jgi:class 3 adenylate cyclase